jgi:AraC-like DNA-binding protein
MLLDVDYNPIQGYVADSGAYKTLLPSSPLNRWVQSYWQLNVSAGQFSYHSVPDNCVDWIINLTRFEDNFVIPPFLSSTLFHLDGPVSFFGIRFRVMGHKGLISIPLGEWGALGSVRATEILPNEVVCAVFESIVKAKCFEERCNHLSVTLLSRVNFADVDSRLVRYIRYCHKNISSNLDLSDKQCGEFGVSARQLRRLTKQNLGLLPKDFAKILRFQYMLKAMKSSQCNNVWLDHYYDQAHFIREFKCLSGFTPTQFKKLSVLYNHDPPE